MKYVKPEFNISKFETEDILTTSTGSTEANEVLSNAGLDVNYSKMVDMSNVSSLLQ